MVNIEKNTEYLTIFERPVRVKNIVRSLNELRLSSTNPRIAHEQISKKAKEEPLTESEIQELLWDSSEVKQLYRSIIVSRGLLEPPYVMPNGRVVEGNERIVALRKIKDRLEDGDFRGEEAKKLEKLIENVPCKEFPSDLSKTEEDIFLTRIHVTGKHVWPALNQARQIYALNEDRGLTVREIKEIIGKSKPWIYQRLQAFKWTVDYLDKFNSGSIHDYSFFSELYKKRNKLKEVDFDIDKPENMEKFQQIVATKDLSKAVQVRKLPKILKNKKTREMMLGGEGRKAIEMLPIVEPGEFSPRFKALEYTLYQLQKMTREDLQAIEERSAYKKLLQSVKHEIEDILNQAGGSS